MEGSTTASDRRRPPTKEAIYYEDDLRQQWSTFTEDNSRFFTETLSGRNGPLESQGSAAKISPVGADTPLVAHYPHAD